MSIDPTIILAQRPVQVPSLDEAERTVGAVEATKSLAENRLAQAQERQQKAQQYAQDQAENGQIQSIFQKHGPNDIEGAMAEASAINPEKIGKYMDAYERAQKFKIDVQNAKMTSMKNFADLTADQLNGVLAAPPEQQQHEYQVALATINGMRNTLGMPPATEMSPTFDAGTVKAYIAKSQAASKAFGAQGEFEGMWATDPTSGNPMWVRKNKQSGLLFNNQGQDVSATAQPYEKGGDKEQSPEVEALKAREGELGRKMTSTERLAFHNKWAQEGHITNVLQMPAAGGAMGDAVQGYKNDMISGAIKLTDIPAAGGMRNLVRASMEKEGWDLNKPLTAQAQARTDLAKLVLPQVNQVRDLARQIDQMGLMGTVGGRWRSLLAGESSADALGGLTPAQRKLVGQFVAQADLLTSGTALTHFGARAGGAAVEHMRSQLDPRNKSIDVFLGNLDAVQSVLGGYAQGLPGAKKQGGTTDPAALRQKYNY